MKIKVKITVKVKVKVKMKVKIKVKRLLLVGSHAGVGGLPKYHQFTHRHGKYCDCATLDIIFSNMLASSSPRAGIGSCMKRCPKREMLWKRPAKVERSCF